MSPVLASATMHSGGITGKLGGKKGVCFAILATAFTTGGVPLHKSSTWASATVRGGPTGKRRGKKGAHGASRATAILYILCVWLRGTVGED